MKAKSQSNTMVSGVPLLKAMLMECGHLWGWTEISEDNWICRTCESGNN